MRGAKMADFLKLLLPVFLSPKDYSEMLRKLASFLFYDVWIATFFLRSIPSIDSAFNSVENFGPIGQAISLIPGHEKLNISGIVIALIVAGVSYAIQLHDRISDLFGIRKRFDRNYILLPLAVLVGVELSPAQLNAMNVNRDALLRAVFYPYVSSRAEHPLVDRHDIERALDTWSWYWVLIELLPVILIALLVAGYFKTNGLLVGFCAAFICFWLLAWLFSLRLERFTRPDRKSVV